MSSFIFIVYETVCSLIAFLPFGIKIKRQVKAFCSVKLFLSCFVFVLYLIVVLHITGAGTLSDAFFNSFTFSSKQINLIPFVSDIIHPLVSPSSAIDVLVLLITAVVESVLNAVLFMPYGIFLYVIWEIKSIKKIAWNSFFFSILIEMSQLLNSRVSDIDDLVFNTFGAVFGMILANLVIKRANLSNKITVLDDTKTIPPFSAFSITLAIFVGRFIFYNEIGLAKILHFV